jgi:hypothetical protein
MEQEQYIANIIFYSIALITVSAFVWYMFLFARKTIKYRKQQIKNGRALHTVIWPLMITETVNEIEMYGLISLRANWEVPDEPPTEEELIEYVEKIDSLEEELKETKKQLIEMQTSLNITDEEFEPVIMAKGKDQNNGH